MDRSPPTSGALRPVVILFADLRGFTALAETLRADLLAGLVADYVARMQQVIAAHGGTFSRFLGDALMAVWGASELQPGDADQAMNAALALHHALAELNLGWRAQGRPAVAQGIGISAGETFAGPIGGQLTVLGDVVNIASRLSAAAAPGEILLDEVFYRSLAEPPPVAERPRLRLQGKAVTLRAYCVKV